MTAVGQESVAAKRLMRDYLKIVKNPMPHVTAHPLPTNILEWRYVIVGPAGTPYENGIYYGTVIFPAEFPFKAPTISMITSSGRFECNTNLCLSITHWHEESWNPVWTVSTILAGLLSFMLEEEPTSGSIDTSDFEKKVLARLSLEFNLQDPTFCELFPEFVDAAGQEGKEKDTIADQKTILKMKKNKKGKGQEKMLKFRKKKKERGEIPHQEILDPQQNFGSSQEVESDQQQDGWDTSGFDLITCALVVVGFAAFVLTIRLFCKFGMCFLH